jgi:uncharacterized membrane protein YheB (UPF0754 family)
MDHTAILTSREQAQEPLFIFDKSFLTNFLAALAIGVGYLTPQPLREYLLSIGYFALSGAITNWLAIHMLFEKVPGCYGSGVIPARFEEFKLGIERLIMGQFFTQDNVRRFFADHSALELKADFAPLIEKVDYDKLFQNLVAVVSETSLGSMLMMFGGASALEKLKPPFIEKTKQSLLDLTRSADFTATLRAALADHLATDQSQIIAAISKIVQCRLDELTPKIVKEIIQDMIRKHLGWLVVWGGVFGALMGFIKALFS